LYFHRYRDGYGSLFASAARYDAAVYLHMRDRYLTRYDCSPWLETIRTRTLVVTGRHDIITPPDRGATRLADAIPNATLHVFEHSGHFPFIEEREPFVDLIGEWLEVS
jgi:proline iminopeptidase